MWDPFAEHSCYIKFIYSNMQMRDTLAGSNAIKSKNELYLPMPTSFLEIDYDGASISNQKNTMLNLGNKIIPTQYVPWNHPNPAYRAYLQRARFSDITANALRGMAGVATKNENKIELESSVEYLIDSVSKDGLTLDEFYEHCIIEALSVGKICIVPDIDENTGEFYLTTYAAESNKNWKTKRKNGAVKIEAISFCDDIDYDSSDETTREFKIDEETGNVRYSIYYNKEIFETDFFSYKGKYFKTIPAFCTNIIELSPEQKFVPLLGISDIALAMYQEDADLRQAHYLTCNPTLFIFGLNEKETPKALGSQVVVAIRNPDGKAEYPKTDTSALEHILNYKKHLMDEASSFGALFLNSSSRQSGEALDIRQSNRGVNLVTTIKSVGNAIQAAIRFIEEIKSGTKNSVFSPNTDFAEMLLNAQDITALVSSWMQGAIDHDTLLDNLRDANYIKAETPNEDIKRKIELEGPRIESGVVEDKNEDEENNESDENEENKVEE